MKKEGSMSSNLCIYCGELWGMMDRHCPQCHETMMATEMERHTCRREDPIVLEKPKEVIKQEPEVAPKKEVKKKKYRVYCRKQNDYRRLKQGWTSPIKETDEEKTKRLKEYQRQYRIDHKDKIYQQIKEWHKKNRERLVNT